MTTTFAERVLGTLRKGIEQWMEKDSSQKVSASTRDAVLVLDMSLSMVSKDWNPSRLAAAQQASLAFVDRLSREEPTAQVAVVAYNDVAATVCSLTPVTERTKIAKTIKGIEVSGSTNITAGLKEALRLLQKRESTTAQVVLLTDGEHTTGREPSGIAAKVREIAILECVGIGGTSTDVDEKLLRSISSKHPDGSPRYRWIGQKEQERLVKVFHNMAGRIRKD